MASKNIYLTPITIDSSTKYHKPGTVRREWNSTDSCFKTYKYVQASLTGTASNGVCLAWYDTLGSVATDDISTTSANLPAGVCIGALTHGNYGWIQVGGYHSALDTTGEDGFADGASIQLAQATDGVCADTAAGTASSLKILGVAVADDVDADDTIAVLLDCNYGDIIQ